MSDITQIERIKLEKLFIMGAGYVLDFSNRTICDFIFEATNINIYSIEYADLGDSKANRLRTVWKKETNHTVSKLLQALLEYFKDVFAPSFVTWNAEVQELYEYACKVAVRLSDELNEHIEAISVSSNDKSFAALGRSVRQLIHEEKPEEAIDRLHTYLTMFLRQLCKKHSITTDANKPVHSLLGEYIKYLVNHNLLETVMSERILKSSISVIEAFNDVRNNNSLAHANRLLGAEESLLIFRNVTSLITFINSTEAKICVDAK